MSARATSSGRDLQSIARRAMLERGFQPDFGAAVLTELGAIPGPAATQSPSIRDLRGLLWASIDNDDSLDLDHSVEWLSSRRDRKSGQLIGFGTNFHGQVRQRVVSLRGLQLALDDLVSRLRDGGESEEEECGGAFHGRVV